MTKLAFVDTETTGLDRNHAEIWEIAIILREDGTPDVEYSGFVTHSIALADPTSLRINNYYNRAPAGTGQKVEPLSPFKIATLLSNSHLVAAVPDFDAFFIEKYLRGYHLAPAWHYHLVCVENLAAGYLGMEPPWNSDELSEKMGIDRNKYEKHTALGDTHWARDMYDAVMIMGVSKPINTGDGSFCTWCGVGPGTLHQVNCEYYLAMGMGK